jgi:hypothetical protein
MSSSVSDDELALKMVVKDLFKYINLKEKEEEEKEKTPNLSNQFLSKIITGIVMVSVVIFYLK